MKILLATDGSEYSTAAAKKLCDIFGGLLDSEIKIVSVYEPMQPIAAEPFAVSAEYYNEISEASRNQAASFASAAVDLVKVRCPEASISHEVLSGKPAPEIVQHAEQWGADMIIVGSHGRGFWGRLLGSVSNGVVNHAPCTVMVVRKPPE